MKFLKPTLQLGLGLGFCFFAHSPVSAEVQFSDFLEDNGGDLVLMHDGPNEGLEALIDRYGILTGFPDHTFRGTQLVNRYEEAAMLYKITWYMERQMARFRSNGCGIYFDRNALGSSSFLLASLSLDLQNLYACSLPSMALPKDLLTLNALRLQVDKEGQEVSADASAFTQRLAEMETVQIHGGLEIRYRDRLWADGARTQLGSTSDTFQSPAQAGLTVEDLSPFRLRSWLEVKGQFKPWLGFATRIEMFDPGRRDLLKAQSASPGSGVSNGGHDLNEGLPDGSPFVFRQAELKLNIPQTGHEFRLGLMNFAQWLNTGTSFVSLFDQGNWNGRDYGFVGWGGADVDLTNTTAAAEPYRNSLSRYWAGGLGASKVDPDSKRYNQVTSPALAWRNSWDSGSFMFGISADSFQTNRTQAANGNLSSGGPAVYANQLNFATSSLFGGAALQGVDRKGKLIGGYLDLPSQFGDGYAVVGVEQRFLEKSFPIRISVSGMHYLYDGLFDFASATRKEISGTIDLGWNQGFGATIQVNKSFIGYDRHSLGLFFNNLGNSGVDVQLGTNMASRGLFNVGDLASGNAGLAVGIPILRPALNRKDDLKVIIGARQAFSDNFGTSTEDGVLNQLFKDSGVTVTVPWRHVASTDLNLTAQYDMLLADALWQMRPVAQDISLIGSYEF